VLMVFGAACKKKPHVLPPTTTPNLSIEEMISRQVQDIYFDYDQFGVRDDARGILSNDANALKAIFQKYPGASVIVEGHCDERGSAEYNLGLADKRSSSTRDYLVQLGVPADKLKTVSYGKERPQCNEATEQCYQKNRRAHFAAAQ
jgi:peptidoglycan-associated lipoprotein